jgi:long-chain acyl-CoA synthetase
MAEAGGLKEKMFHATQATANARKQLEANGQSSGWLNFKYSILDSLVGKKVRERFGGRLKYAFSGGAALSKDVAEFIDNLGIMVYEGYGLTETSPIATCNWPGNRKIGSIGKPIPGVDIEIDTAVTNDPENGEIVVYGHNVMKGYHGLEEENEKVFVEKNGKRGFRTGDMGRKDDQGFVYITGRIKEQYKLLNGKYVVPSPLEEQIKLSPFIANAMVYGDNREYNVALIVPDEGSLKKWAAEQGLSGDLDALVKDKKVREHMKEELAKVSASFKSFDRCKDFALVTEDFTTANGMLTPTLKLKRREVMKRYGDVLENLYKAAETAEEKAASQSASV